MEKIRRLSQHYSTWISCSILCAAVWCLYLGAFWPGILSYDSLSQFDQATRNAYTDWHPVFHTLNLKFLLLFWKSPAVMALFQILALSLVAGYGLYVFRKKGVPRVIILLVCLLFSLNLINGMLVITLWKDVLYSISVMLLNILVINVVDTAGGWLRPARNWILLGITGGLVTLYRHNGFPIPVITMLALAGAYRAHWKDLLKSTAVLAVMLLVVYGAIYPLFHVEKDSGQPASVVFVHPLDAEINNLKDYQNTLSANDLSYLNAIYPLKKGWSYSCYDATVFFYQIINFAPLQKDPLRALEILIKLASRDPKILVRHFFCLSSFTWRLDQPDGVYLESVLYTSIDATVYPAWTQYQPMIAQRSALPAMRQVVMGMQDLSTRIDPRKISWRPAIYLYLFAAAVIATALSNKNAKLLLILVPVAAQTAIIMLVAQLEAVRYQYPVYLVSMAFTLPLLFYRAGPEYTQAG